MPRLPCHVALATQHCTACTINTHGCLQTSKAALSVSNTQRRCDMHAVILSTYLCALSCLVPDHL